MLLDATVMLPIKIQKTSAYRSAGDNAFCMNYNAQFHENMTDSTSEQHDITGQTHQAEYLKYWKLIKDYWWMLGKAKYRSNEYARPSKIQCQQLP